MVVPVGASNRVMVLLEGTGPEEQAVENKSGELHVGGVWLREGSEEVAEGVRRWGE